MTESPPDPCGKARLKSLQDPDQRTAAAKRARELIEIISGDRRCRGGAKSVNSAPS